MTMRIDRYTKAVLTVIAASLCMFNVGGTGVQAQTTVLTDQQLLALAHDTYERATKAGNESDYMYAALHINALLQRNPAAVQNDPAFAKQLEEALAFAGARIQVWLKLAEQATPQARAEAGKKLPPVPIIQWPSPQ